MKKTACKQKEKKNRLLTLLLLLLAVVCIFGPLYMTVVIALKSPQEMSHVLALPRHIQWSNFAKAWDMTDYPRKFANTLFITLVNLIFTVFTNHISRLQELFNEVAKTHRKVVVMGRKTLESFPNGLPLKNRTNVVLTSDKNYQVKDAVIVHSIDEVLEELKKYDDDEIYVLGGGKVYEELLPYCDVAHVTKIDFAYEADAYFPDLDEDPDWEVTAESEEQTYFDLEYTFVKYERKDK